MSDLEHLRRTESSRISSDARTRLEGKVEFLEDALALLASARAALEREVQSRDDAGTLRELAGQWAKTEKALAAVDALPDGSGAELTAVVKRERDAVLGALAARGIDAGEFDSALRAAADDINANRTTPGPGETRFRESRVSSELGSLFGGLAVGAYVMAMLFFADEAGRYPFAWGVGLLIIVATLISARRRAAWSMHPNGFFARGKRWPWSAVTVHPPGRRSTASVTFGDVQVEGADVARLVKLLQAPALQGLARAKVGRWTRVRDVFSVEVPLGTLTMSSEETDLVCVELGAREPVSGEDLCEVLAHLSAERLRALGVTLAEKKLARWQPRSG